MTVLGAGAVLNGYLVWTMEAVDSCDICQSCHTEGRTPDLPLWPFEKLQGSDPIQDLEARSDWPIPLGGAGRVVALSNKAALLLSKTDGAKRYGPDQDG